MAKDDISFSKMKGSLSSEVSVLVSAQTKQNLISGLRALLKGTDKFCFINRKKMTSGI